MQYLEHIINSYYLGYVFFFFPSSFYILIKQANQWFAEALTADLTIKISITKLFYMHEITHYRKLLFIINDHDCQPLLSGFDYIMMRYRQGLMELARTGAEGSCIFIPSHPVITGLSSCKLYFIHFPLCTSNDPSRDSFLLQCLRTCHP